MTDVEEPGLEQVKEEEIDNENSSGDSGIQINQKDEDQESDDKTEGDSADKTEEDDTAITESPKHEGADEIAPTTEDESGISDATKEVVGDLEKTGEDLKSESKDENIHLVTVELSTKNDHTYSPEIVVEPKFTERLPIARITSSESIRPLTPVYAVPLPVQLPTRLRPLRAPKKRSFCKKFRHWVTLVLFTPIVFGYAIGGAYLFSYLESKREIEYNAKIDKWKNDTAILLATELRQVKPHEEVWARKVFQYLEVFEKDLLKASAVGYRRQEHEDRGQRWTWSSSFFFSISLMTTTGYGPMTPRSKVGRIATVSYSILGVPLAIGWYSLIGCILANFWVSLFQNICCRLCHEKPPEILSGTTPVANKKDSSKLQKVRSNSIVPIEEQKLIVQTDSQLQLSAKTRRGTFLENLQSELTVSNNQPTKNERQLQNGRLQKELAQMQEVYHTMDYAVAIIYAILFFVVYYIFFSIFFAMYERWVLTDVLYFSYLMFSTLGPGCHEFEDDGAEIKIKNNLLYSIHLCIGHCILAMIANLILDMLNGRRRSKAVQKSEIFDSFHRQRF